MLCRGAFQPVCPLPRWRTLRCFRLVCFHCLRVRLSWRTRRGGGGLEQRRRGRSRSSRGHSGGQAGGTPGPERAVGVGWAVLWRKGCQRAPPEVYPYSDYGVQLPSEGRGSTPPTFCTCCLSPLLCSLGAPLVALLSKNGQTSRSLCLGSSGGNRLSFILEATSWNPSDQWNSKNVTDVRRPLNPRVSFLGYLSYSLGSMCVSSKCPMC